MLLVVDFPTTPFDSSLQGCFPSSLVVKVVIFFSVPLSQRSNFYSFITEALWCCALHPSPHFFEDRVLFLLIHLTGVLYHLFNIFSSHQVFFSFLPECCPNSVILVPWLSHYTGVVIFFWFLKLLFHVFQPTRFSNVPCSSFLTECFQLCSSLLYSFFQVVQPFKVLWFHSFVKEAT